MRQTTGTRKSEGEKIVKSGLVAPKEASALGS